MQNYGISSEVVMLPQTEPNTVKNLLALTNNRVWIYFYSGLCQYWDLYDFNLKAPRLINSMKINPGIHHTFAISTEKIAFYDHIAQRLKVINLAENKIEPNFWFVLPTNNVVATSERNDERKIEDICRDYTKLLAFTGSQTIVTMEKTMSNSTSSDSVISVFRESHCPEPCKQKIHNSNTSSMATLNSEDTIIIYQTSLEKKTNLFFIWNVFSDEKTMRKIVIKNDLIGQVISMTSLCPGTFAVWMNVSCSGNAEVGVVDYEGIEKEKKEGEIQLEYSMDRLPITCFNEDWMLHDVIFLDPGKNLALLSINGDVERLELISTRNFRPYFSKLQDADFSQSASLDHKYFVDYVYHFAPQEEDDYEEDNMEEEKAPEKELKVVMNNVINMRFQLFWILEKKKMTEKYGKFLTNEIVDMLTLESPK